MTLATNADQPLMQRLRDRREEFRELGREAGDLASGAGNIARAEARLAVTEVREGIRATVRTAIFGSSAAAAALVTLIWLPVPLLLGLSEFMELWLAGLAAVGVLLLVTAVLGLVAYRHMRTIELVPRAALSRMREDAKWLTQQLSNEPG